jgi:hypothetical protein
MTVYELATSIPPEQRRMMTDAGILNASTERYIAIFEKFAEFRASGLSKMESYAEVSHSCFTCEENVRKIIKRMEKKVQPDCMG